MPTFRMPVVIQSPNASKAVNVWHFRAGLWNDPSIVAENVAGAVNALRAMYLSINVYYPGGTTITSEGPVEVTTGNAPTAAFAPITVGGTSGNTPVVLALCTSWKTSSRTRRGTGRTFFGPLNASWVDATGTPVDANLTQFRTQMQSFVDASKVDNGWAFGVYGQVDAMPKANAASRQAAPHVFRDFVSYTVKDSFSVMRSRRP